MLTCPHCSQILTQGELDKKRCFTCDSPVYYHPLPPMKDDRDPLPPMGEDRNVIPNTAVPCERTATDDLLERHATLCRIARTLMARKNHDYAGADGETPFRNFEMADNLGVCTVESGIILRMGDKLQRLATFAKDGKLEVTGETTLDAVLDLINYAVILQAYIESKEAL